MALPGRDCFVRQLVNRNDTRGRWSCFFAVLHSLTGLAQPYYYDTQHLVCNFFVGNI